MKCLFLFLSSVVAREAAEEVPPEASCLYHHSFDYGRKRKLMCSSAHYPPNMPRPRSVSSGTLTLHLGASCAIDDLPLPPQRHTEPDDQILVVRRGGCTFSEKARAAWAQGFDGLVIVDYPASFQSREVEAADGDADANTSAPVPPSLAGLEAPVLSSDQENQGSPLPPAVVLISDEDFTLVATHPSTVRLALMWENEWAASDAATLYYDGMRLILAGKYTKAAENFRSSATTITNGRSSASSFKAPGYEWANALLRAGSPTATIVNALHEARVLPEVFYPSTATRARHSGGGFDTTLGRSLAQSRAARAWLAAEYASQARAAHQRTFGFAHGDTVSRRDRESRSAWHVTPGMGLALHHSRVLGDVVRRYSQLFIEWQCIKQRSDRSSALSPPNSGEELGSDGRSNSEVHSDKEEGTETVVVTVATDLGAELSSLRATVAAAGLDFVVLGLGREYGSRGGTKLLLMEEWLSPPEFTSKYLQKNGPFVYAFFVVYNII